VNTANSKGQMVQMHMRCYYWHPLSVTQFLFTLLKNPVRQCSNLTSDFTCLTWLIARDNNVWHLLIPPLKLRPSGKTEMCRL